MSTDTRKKTNYGFKEHQYRLYLDRVLYLATVRFQADKGLGRTFSALWPFIEGLHVLKYLSDAEYELYRNKYSVGLEEAAKIKANIKTPAQILNEEKKANKYKQLNRKFKEVIAQWDTLKQKSRAFHLKEAEKNKNLKFARALLEKGAEEQNGGLKTGEV